MPYALWRSAKRVAAPADLLEEELGKGPRGRLGDGHHHRLRELRLPASNAPLGAAGKSPVGRISPPVITPNVWRSAPRGGSDVATGPGGSLEGPRRPPPAQITIASVSGTVASRAVRSTRRRPAPDRPRER